MSDQNQRRNPYEGLTREQVLTTMRQLVKEESLNHYRMGQLYNYVVDSKLVEGTPHKNAVNFFTANIQEVSRATLLAYGAVAGAFSEEVCSRFGMTRLRLLLTYKAATQMELNHEEPGGTFILVPDANGVVQPKLFADCGVEEMRKALGQLREATPSKPIPAEDVALVDQYRDAILARFPKGTRIRVQVRREGEETVMDVKGIPVRQVDKVTEALLEQAYPVQEMPEVEVQVQEAS